MKAENFIDLDLYFVVYDTKKQNEVGKYVIASEELDKEILLKNMRATLKQFGCEKIKETILYGLVQVKTSECLLQYEKEHLSKYKLLMIDSSCKLIYKSVYIIVFKGANQNLFRRIVALPEYVIGIEDIILEVKDMYENIEKIISVT
ncbi:TPA: hypothetical protein UX919_003060, partial [Enterococcus faecalis]|nr:hypothetical protein [Enterococcus faecalis]